MKIAFIGDIHGNQHALNAVLADIEGRGVKTIVNTGDLVGYGPLPDKVVKSIKHQGIKSIVGNYDLKVLEIKKKSENWRRRRHPLKLLAFEWAWAHLSKSSRKFLAGLPRELSLKFSGLAVQVSHTGPLLEGGEFLGPDTPPEVLQGLVDTVADLSVFGHTHLPFAHQVAGKWFVNTGSVGRPEGDPRACYALVRLSEKDIQVEHIRVQYDIQKAAKALRRAGLPKAFIQMLKEGKNLDSVLDDQPKTMAQLGKSAEKKLIAVEKFAKECDPAEIGHARQVAHLSLRIFDELVSLHKLGEKERFYLHCAALLHDVGWMDTGRPHHKASFKLIMKSTKLPFEGRQRKVIANIARYHRKALPKPSHSNFASLKREDRKIVKTLGGILRVADGLDRQHLKAIEDLECRISGRKVEIVCFTRGRAESERAQALKKADLFEAVFSRELIVGVKKI